MSESSPENGARRATFTDSPWFWVLLFSAAGLAALAIISGQYAKRQRRLEMQYQAAQEIARRQVTGEAKARPAGDEGEAPPPAPGELIIPLWPLAAVFAAVLATATLLLWRDLRPTATVGDADHAERGKGGAP